MICQIYPQIEGIALERFRRLSKDVMHLQRTGQLDRLDGLRDGELQRCQGEPGLNGCLEKYEACVRVLIDLAKLRWRIEEDRFGIELVAPRSNVVDPGQIAEYKETVRNRHLAAERDLNRLDAFIDEIKGREPERKRQFILFSSESRLVTRVTLAPDFKQYTEVEPL